MTDRDAQRLGNDGTQEESSFAPDIGRLEAFSDGVFAIAITLLILDVRLPTAEVTNGTELWTQLLNLWPQYIALIISFFFIGIGWINHHRILNFVDRSNTALQLVNLVLLFTITTLPFPTSVLAEHLNTSSAPAAILFYNSCYVVIAVAFTWFWRVIRDNVSIHKAHIAPVVIARANRQYRLGLVLYCIVLLIGLINGPLSLVCHVALAIFFALPLLERNKLKTKMVK